MTSLFNRKYKLTVVFPKKENYSLTEASPLEEGYTPTFWQKGADFRTVPATEGVSSVTSNYTEVFGEKTTEFNTTKQAGYRNNKEDNALEITDLQIVTNISNNSNTASGSGGNTTIEVFNLSAHTRDLVEQDNNSIILEAGYAEDEELVMIFSGQVMSSYTERRGTDLVTYLTCGEGYAPNNSIRISKKFREDYTYADVLYYLADVYAKNGIPTGDIIVDWSEGTVGGRSSLFADNNKTLAEKVAVQVYPTLPVLIARPNQTKLVTGYSAIGYLHQVLENICKQIGYVSYITAGRLFIHPKGFTKTIEEYEFTSAQMKSIRRMSDKTTNSSTGKGISGVRITTFLDGRLDIDKRIKVLDGQYAASYKIISKTHTLDYERGAWDTTITCTVA